MTANTAGRRERRNPKVWSVKATGASAILAGIIGVLCVARVASAEPAALTLDDFKGRWVSERITLDISRCGEGFCGVVVANNVCGHTALRVSASGMGKGDIFHPSGYVTLEGQLQLAAGAQPYGVQAALSRDEEGKARLFVAGHNGGAFSAIRRMYDYRDLMVRAGDAACTPAAKTS